jgi:hypothetical protein
MIAKRRSLKSARYRHCKTHAVKLLGGLGNSRGIVSRTALWVKVKVDITLWPIGGPPLTEADPG